VPGIHLQAPLALDFKVGALAFEDAALRIYTPPSTDWQQANPSFQPVYGYTGRLSIASAGITLKLSADLEWGLPRAFLYARGDGVTLGKLSQLVDIAGTDALSSAMPDELKSAVDALARELAAGPTLAIGGAKRLFHQSTWESLETQMELEAQAIAASGHTEDFREGVTAFANKQTPTFKGR
jgi:enoyl-CoA hydratase/carnithine racemase